MSRPLARPVLVALLVLAAALVVAGCGSSDDDRSKGSQDRSASTKEEATEPGSREAVEEKSSVAGFVESPALTACMEQAGFTKDAPPTGGLVAWRHPSGGRVVVASGEDVTLGIASEIGTAERPANVDGDHVIAATPELEAAAAACLDA